jgi:hypothetical protein
MSASADVLCVERVEVRESDVVARVRVPDDRYMRTSASPGLSRRAFDMLPGLRRHVCSNDAGRPFERELSDTETAHLFEHVVCELMALAGSPRNLSAQTSWDFAREGRGVFAVRVEYEDDLVALGALKSAVPLVNWLVLGAGEAPDVDSVEKRLAALRGD